MNEIWNELELIKPQLQLKVVNKTKFVNHVISALNDYLNDVNEKYKEFCGTSALLNQLRLRRKNSFRRMKGFQWVCKLNVAIKRIFVINLTEHLEFLRDAMPFVDIHNINAVNVPSRESLDYVLVRCVTIQRIHERIERCCLEIGKYFVGLIEGNHFMDIGAIFLAVVAKLQTLSAYYGNKCIKLYRELLKHRLKFPQSGEGFLPEDTELPTELTLFEEMQDNLNTERHHHQVTKTTLNNVLPRIFQRKEDLGEVIVREEPKPNIQKFQIHDLVTVEDVKKFIHTETEKRKKSPKTCLTKNVENHQWLAAKRIFEHKLLSNNYSKAIEMYQKFIKSKI